MTKKLDVDGKLVDLTPDEEKQLELDKKATFVANTRQVSDTQFIQALAEKPYEIISWAEAQAWGSKGELPKLLVDALDSVKDDTTRNRAYMKAMSAKTYIADDPWLLQIMQLLPGWDKDKLQQLFNFAATL